jgi:hypothetical protein
MAFTVVEADEALPNVGVEGPLTSVQLYPVMVPLVSEPLPLNVTLFVGNVIV